MFTVLFITLSGIGAGYLMRNVRCLLGLQKSITWTIYFLLFVFGLQVGANELVVNNLDTLGLKALAIAVAGSLGSAVAALLVSKLAFRKDTLQYAKNTTQCSAVCNEFTAEEATSSIGQTLSPTTSGIMNYLGGFIVVAFFVVGCIVGLSGRMPVVLLDGKFSMYVLYALMIQVGMSIGCDKRLKEILMSLRPRMLLLPLGTIVGTLIFVAAVSLVISDMRLADCLAVGAGFGYYSLSSVLITQIKEVPEGVAVAAQLGTVALMANIMREVITLLFAPIICKIFGRLAPISVGGATSMDSTLPVITAVCGKEMVFISIFHGVLVDFSVPFLVTFFASL